MSISELGLRRWKIARVKAYVLGEQLAPAARANVAFDEFASFRRLEVDAAIAALVALRRARYLASAWLIFRCAPDWEIAVAAVATPSASAVPVSTTRPEMRWQSFLPLFMIELR